jgi:hypothetical protein
MATQTDNVVLYNSGKLDKVGTTDTISLTGNLTLGGNLTVNGTQIINQSETVLINDNHLYMNNGYATNAAQTGGLVVNYLPTTTTTTANGNYVAGVDDSSNPQVTTAGSGTFSAGDFIQVGGTVNPGLYEVASHSGTTLQIRSTANGTTDQLEDFTQNQFVAAGSDGATIVKVNISVIRAGTDGDFETAKGSATGGSGITFSNIGTVSIAADDITTGDAAVNIQTSTGGISVGTTGNQAVTLGNTNATQTINASALDLNASAATLDATTLSIDSTDTTNLTMTSNSGSNKVLTVAATNAGGGEAQASITATDQLTVGDGTGTLIFDGGAVSTNAVTSIDLDGSGAIAINSSGGTIAIGNDNVAQNVAFGAGGARTITIGSANATAVNIDAIALSLDAKDNSNLGLTANSAADKTLTVAVSNSGSGAGLLDVDADGAITVDAGAGLSLQGGAASDFTSSTGLLTVSGGSGVTVTSTGGTLTLNGTGQIVDLNGASLDIDTTAGVTMDATGISLDSDAASNFTTSSGALTLTSAAAATWSTGAGKLSITGAGGIDLDTSGGAGAVTLLDNNAAALEIKEGSNSYLKFNTTNSLEGIVAGKPISVDSSIAIFKASGAGAALNQGDIVYLTSSNNYQKASAATSSADAALPIGTAQYAASNGANVLVGLGGIVKVKFGSNPAGGDVGNLVYLDTTAGQGTQTAPTASGSRVYRLGILLTTGAAVCDVLWQPQMIIDNP